MEVLFTEDAPVSGDFVTVEEGRSGPAVEKMQRALADIGLYSGDMDGIYDIDVIEAVKKFQAACAYSADGVATPEMQQALYYQAGKLEELFGEGSVPQPEMVEEEVNMAKVKAEVKIRIRAKASTDSKELGKVSNGDTVMVLSVDGRWAKVYANGTGGFMYKKYLEPYTEYNYILKYASGETEYSIGHTMEEYAQGAKRFALEFRDISEEEARAAAVEIIRIATINTGSDDIMLNLRAEADGESEVLEQIANGTAMRIMEEGEEWTKVTYGNSIGYLMNQYLEFSDGTVDDLTATANAEAAQRVIPARVASQSGAGGKVYASASKDAKVLGSLKNGTELDAIGAEGDWIKIRYEGKEGYMLKKDLQQVS